MSHSTKYLAGQAKGKKVRFSESLRTGFQNALHRVVGQGSEEVAMAKNKTMRRDLVQHKRALVDILINRKTSLTFLLEATEEPQRI
jgi:hypothetical protein